MIDYFFQFIKLSNYQFIKLSSYNAHNSVLKEFLLAFFFPYDKGHYFDKDHFYEFSVSLLSFFSDQMDMSS